MSELELVGKYRSFGGWTEFYKHASSSTQTEMRFSVYRPPQAEARRVPVLYWLSGLTCTEENFMAKAGAQRYAAEHGILIVSPDTSPRGAGISGEDESWDFGLGAGFYLDAIQAPWSKNYHMESYVTSELRSLVEKKFPVTESRGISGHSMGGHGALVLSLRNPKIYRSVSAFAPITAPSLCPWGQKAFKNYLGDDKRLWEEYDASHLVKKLAEPTPLLIDQGADDKFLREQLLLPHFEEICRSINYPLDSRTHAGYDHSYYFIATFIGEHIAYHANILNK